MTQDVGSATLGGGEQMLIKVVECPAEEYADPLLVFLSHKSDETLRDMKRRLEGHYAQVSLDRWFLGEVGGQIVSQMGYMLARDTLDVGVFGHVYTRPEHRGKGAASVLMQALMDDFNAGPGQALLCGTGSESAARIYARHGFVPLVASRAPVGPLAYIKPDFAADFAELQAIFFEPGHDTRVRQAHMGDRAKVDKVLLQSDGVAAIADQWHRLPPADAWANFVTMAQMRDDECGPLNVLETDGRHVVGYAFVFRPEGPEEAGPSVLDFLVHPNYLDQGLALLRRTLADARGQGVWPARAQVAAGDVRKLELLRAAGMTEADEPSPAGPDTIVLAAR